MDDAAYSLRELAMRQDLDCPEEGGGNRDNVKVIEVRMWDLDGCYCFNEILLNGLPAWGIFCSRQ